MPKLLIRRDIVKGDQETLFVKNTDQDYHCKHGKIDRADLEKKDGTIVATHTGVEYILLTPAFSDIWERFKRIPQSMIAKDIGLIITTCGLGKDSTVAEAGSGNGSLTAHLAHTCKKVLSYDVNEKHIANAQANTEQLGLTNITFHNADISEALRAKDVDCIILDVPEPWTALATCKQALKIGGWLVTYSPSTTQVQQTKEESQGYVWIKTSEVIERTWKLGTRICRPDNISIGHTAFLSFYRRIE